MSNEKFVSPLTEDKKSPLFKRFVKNPYLRYFLFGLVIAMVPILSEAGVFPIQYISIIGGVVMYSIVALGLNLLLGYSGLISLGTAGFMGLGAYLSGYLTVKFELPWLLGLAAAVFVAALIGVMVGFVSLKVAGIYLAIVTLCVSEILRKTFEELDQFTGGFSGFQGKYPTFFGYRFDRTLTFILATIALVLIMMLTHNLVNGQFGRALHAMRGSEVAAQAMGINLLKYRLIVFAIATAYATLGGVFYVSFIRFAAPGTWIMMLSLNILAAVVIGGLRSIYGTVFGVFVIFAVPDLIIKPIFGDIKGISYVFSGVLIILVVMFYPSGLKAVPADIKRFFKWIFRKKEVKTNIEEGGNENG